MINDIRIIGLMNMVGCIIPITVMVGGTRVSRKRVITENRVEFGYFFGRNCVI